MNANIQSRGADFTRLQSDGMPGCDQLVSQGRVVLLPCSAGAARQWQALTKELVGLECRSLDLIGHENLPPWHGEGSLTLSEEAAAIKNALPHEPFHLIGHSYGGSVALTAARLYPERLLSLTLIEPSSFHVLKYAEAAESRLLDEVKVIADTVNRSVVQGDYAAGMSAFVDYWSGPGTWAGMPTQKKERMMRLSLHITHHFHALIDDPTPLSDYGKVSIPTMIICGTHSPAPCRAISRLLAEVMPEARHRTARGANHMSAVNDPDRINPLIAAYIRDQGKGMST